MAEDQRVFALRDANETHVYSYGVGTYIGDLLCPIKVEMFGGEDSLRERLRRITEQNDAVPIEESALVGLFDALGPGDTLKTREDFIAAEEAERRRPLFERIQEQYERVASNPCIHLDNGDIVWGIQCWWGDEARMDEKVAGRTVEIVPVPDGNGRWK